MQIMAFTVGDILDPRKTLSMDWAIPDYFSLSQKTDNFYDSPDFHFLNSTWCIRIFPNGERWNDSVEFVGLYLQNLSTEFFDELSIVNLGVKYPNGEIYRFETFGDNFYRTYGSSKFMERRHLRDLKSVLAPRGILTLFCSVNSDEGISDDNILNFDEGISDDNILNFDEGISDDKILNFKTALFDGKNTLSRDFRELFLSGQKTDVSFRVDGRILKAHKLILETRSPVFAAVFHHHMRENGSEIVNIVDCDSETFANFLLFVYTGVTEKFSCENIISLYSLADKYQMKELKEICVDFMVNNLTVDTVCDIITLAERHNEEHLKVSAKEFIVSNIKRIIPTEKWISLMRENTTLAAQLFMTALPANSS